MRGIVFALSLSALLVLRLAPPGSEQKTEAGLIAAWAQKQKSDPTTIKFEKTKDRQYHFATKRFPFDGELLVRNVVLEDYPGVNQDGISTGTVEVELQGVNEEFHRTFAASYGKWISGNTLYWDPKQQHWLTSEQYFQQVRERIPKQIAWPALVSFGWSGILLAIFVGLFFVIWRSNKRVKVLTQRGERSLQLSERNAQLAERNAQIFEQTLKLQEQNAKLFQDILEELKKISGRP